MDRVIDIDIRGVFATTQAALKHMTDGGRIINIGFAAGERVQTPGLVPYSATKGAVKIFTQGLSREVGARGITVSGCGLQRGCGGSAFVESPLRSGRPHPADHP